MSIKIENVSKDGRSNSDVHSYTLEANKGLTVSFEHVRDDGLAACLRAAADAVDAAMTKDETEDEYA